MIIGLSDFTLNENTDLQKLDNLNYVSSFSPVETTFNFLSESRVEYNNINKELYKSIYESTSYEAINESFSDFYEKIKELIDKFIAFIKSLVERFVTLFNRMINNEKYLLKHKDRFKDFNSEDEFEIEGFEYSIDDPAIPSVSCVAEFNNDFMKLNLADILDVKNDTKDISERLSRAIGEAKENMDSQLDSYRGAIIGELREIDEADFSDELYTLYRSGYDSKYNITVDSSRIDDSLTNLENYKERISTAKKTSAKIEKEYNSLKKSIDRMSKRNKDNDASKLLGIEVRNNYTDDSKVSVRINEEALAKLNAFTKAKIAQVEKLSSAHAMAFSYKIEAIKECYIQDKRILYNALKKIEKNHKLYKEV